MRAIVVIAIFLLLGIASKPGMAQKKEAAAFQRDAFDPLVLDDANLYDLTGRLRFLGTAEGDQPAQIVAALRSKTGHSFRNALSIAFEEKVQWLAVNIENPDKVAIPMVVSLDFPVHSMDLLRESNGTVTRLGLAGLNEMAVQRPASPLPAIGFVVPPGSATYYLGFGAQNEPAVIHPKLWRAAAFDNDNQSYLLSIMGLFSAALGLVVYNAVLGFYLRYRVIYYYIFTGLFYCCLSAVMSGLGQLLPSPFNVTFIHSWPLFNALMCFGLVLFSEIYLGISRTEHHKIANVLDGYLVLTVLFVPAYFLGNHRLVFVVFSLLTTIMLGIITLMAAREALRKNLYGIYYVVSFLPVIAITHYDSQVLLGIIHDPSIHTIAMMLAGTANLAMLSITVGLKIQQMRHHHEALKVSLKGVIADGQIETLAAGGFKTLRKPMEQTVTVMFVDIVGYSMIFGRMGGAQAFYSLKKVLGELSAIVHRHGGVLDKSLGDGILAFFGYNLNGEVNDDHPRMAFRCAIEMQTKMLSNTLDAVGSNAKSPVFPLRIGINTSQVFIGNMGDDSRFDVTISGDGVVMASRFEGVCEPYKIILGESTKAHLEKFQPSPANINKILIPVKHLKGLMEAYEHNPFADRGDDLRQANAIFWQVHAMQRTHERQFLSEPVVFNTSFGAMNMINFSAGGFCLDGPTFLGKGASFELRLDPLMDVTEYTLVSPLMVEVMWSMVNESGSYRHGVRIVGANAAQRTLVLSLIETKLRGLSEIEGKKVAAA